MDCEIELAGVVRDWAQRRCPDDPSVTEGAVTVALRSFDGGASVSEAYEMAHAFVACRVSHPAGIRAQGHARLRLAS